MKEWVEKNEGSLLFVTFVLLGCLFMIPKEATALVEAVYCLWFGIIFIINRAITPTFIPLVIWKGLGILNAIMFIIHAILLFLVLFKQV